MGRFPPLQIALLAFGCSLILAAVFLDHIAARWENFLYPNAVHWQNLRIVPAKNQRIVVPGENVLVVKDADALLTLFRRADDNFTPQSMIKDLCRRDGCTRSTIAANNDDLAVATYNMRGASMQIVLMRLGGGAVWIEYKGTPEGFAGFNEIIRSVSTQLAERQARGPG
jgi:hypothetical protein